jgi:hypothetical protein
MAVAEKIAAFLRCLGWPEAVLSDSGNGWHLYYHIDLPNDPTSYEAVKRFLKALAGFFDNDTAKIGAECYNADRYSRVPGSWSRRGVASNSRPWRKCQLVRVPEYWGLVGLGQIVAAAEKLEALKALPEAERYAPSTFVRQAHGSDAVARYVAAAVDGEMHKVANAPPSTRNNQLFKSSAALAEFLPGGHLEEQALGERIFEWAKMCGLHQDPGCGEEGIRKTILSGFRHGKGQPRELPGAAPALPAVTAVEPGKSVLVQASTVEPRRVEWLMPGRIPLGKLTTFAGMGGLGKTFVLLDIAARLTRGAAWPGENGVTGTPGKVIFASGEDDIEDTLVPRLIELKADLTQVFFFKSEVLGKFTLADLATLDRAIADAGPGVKLICIDPPTAYLGDVNDHSNSELRGLLSPLKEWASRHHVALVFITHVNKAQGQLEAMARVIGGVAWVNAVRAAHLFAKDPEDEERCVFVAMKMNLAKRRNGLAYRIVESGDVARVEWLGEIETTADQAVKFQVRPRKQMAREWLIEKFKEQLEWESRELFQAAKEAGISRSAMFEAKDALALPKAKRSVTESGDTSWRWWVPPDWPHLFQVQESVEPVEPVEPVETEVQKDSQVATGSTSDW